MNTNPKQIFGNWNDGWALDKHSLSSTYKGDNEYGRPQFDTIRTEVGEATYQLKYKNQHANATPLAQAIADHIYIKFPRIGFIVPMPASTQRALQPVTEVARILGGIVKVPVFENILFKNPTDKKLKDLHSKEEKLEAIGNSIHIHDAITSQGKWNVLVIDDLFHTGASMEKACSALKTYSKVAGVYVATLTWR